MVKDYKRAFYIACELLNGTNFYGIDADKIYEICMEEDGVVSGSSYGDYILNHLDEIDHGEYKDDTVEDKPIRAYWFIKKDCEGKTRTCICSNCGNRTGPYTWKNPNYCEECGAKMESYESFHSNKSLEESEVKK